MILFCHAGIVDGWWTCELCGDFFKNQSSFAYHLATKTHYRERLLEEFGANGSTCPKCKKVLNSQKELFKHLASVHKVVFTYYSEEMKERGLEENEQLERRRDHGESNESVGKSLVVETDQYDEGELEVNHHVPKTVLKKKDDIGAVEENMELSDLEPSKDGSHEMGEQIQTAVELSGDTSHIEEEHAVAEETYMIESMTEGETGDVENNVFIESGVDFQAASHPEELLKRNGDTVIAHICQFCDQGFASDRTFMSHLASTHYWERLKQEYGSDVTRCPICHKVLSRPSSTLHHIAEVHKVVMQYYAEKS